MIPEKLDLSSIGVLTGWTATNFSTTETSLGSVNVTIPTGCTKVLILGSVRLQAQGSGTVDITARVRYDGGTAYTYLAYFTSLNTFGGANVSIVDILDVTAGSKAFALMARSGAGNSNSTTGRILIIPLKA